MNMPIVRYLVAFTSGSVSTFTGLLAVFSWGSWIELAVYLLGTGVAIIVGLLAYAELERRSRLDPFLGSRSRRYEMPEIYNGKKPGRSRPSRV